jgi:hypothetical protein
VRISYPIVLILALVLVGGLWWLRTRDMDFMTPKGFSGPLPDYVTRSYDPDLSGELPNPVSRSPDANPSGDPAPNRPDDVTLGLGDLASSPGLSEYREHSRRGAAHLAGLATELENRGEFQRALLAWERILDSCQGDEEDRRTASDALQRIQPTLPRWNIDPEGDIALLLQLGTTRTASDELSETAREVAEFLRKDSSDIVALVPRITTSQVPGAPARSPIAIYFTGPLGPDSAQSNVLSTNPPEQDPEALRRELLAVIYRLVQGHLATLEGLSTPPPPAHLEDPALDFQRHITRLHWKYFADSLARPLVPRADETDEAPPSPEEPQPIAAP